MTIFIPIYYPYLTLIDSCMHAHALSQEDKMTCFLEWKEYDLRILLEILLICYSMIYIHVIHYVYNFFCQKFWVFT